MQNKLFRGLFISLFALTMTACVGAVNIDAGEIAEAKTEKTDEPAPEIKTVIITEPESQEVVEIPNSCLTNPFGDTCMENFATERESITMKCIADVTGDLCHQAITQVCLNTFSPRLCNKIPTYLDEFKACGYELDSESCAPTITRVCNDFENNFGSDFGDAFNLLCEEEVEPKTQKVIEPPVKKLVESKPPPPNPCIANPFGNTCRTDFNSARESVCANERKSYRCRSTILRVCSANPLNALCIGNETYYYPQKRVCASERNSDRCAPTIARVCDADPLDSLCDRLTAYYPARKIACADKPNSSLCTSTIRRVCDKDLFDSLCNRVRSYYPAQEIACASEPNSARCDVTIRRVCKTTPFDTLCQSKNLTLFDFPVARFSTFFESIEGFSPSGSCRYVIYLGDRCYGLYPTNIDIKPLNENNTGIATYTGSVSLRFWQVSGYSNRGGRHATTYINLTVNFGNKRLSYSGRVGSKNFSINGSFTDRGQIAGSVNFDGNDGDLIGLIGQDKAIGVFSSNGRWKRFGGGFEATREEE